jgi:hypothetical protein
MKKRYFFALAFVTAALFVLGCSEPADKEKTNESLAYSVYAGPDAAGSWATFAFTKDGDGEDVLYYFPDNAACYDAAYVYSAGSGAVTEIRAVNQAAKDAPTAATPGAFTISADEKTITFTSYAGGGGQTFVRRRGKGGDRSADDPPPADLTPLAAGQSLDGTVWAATAYRTRDWTTLVITGADGNPAAGTITVSHSFDCTSFPRIYTDYAYGQNSTLAYIGPFTVSGNPSGDVFTFLDFYGHGGTITLNRMK